MNLFIQKSMNAKTAISAKYANDSFAQNGFLNLIFHFTCILARVPPSRSLIIPSGGYPDEMDQRPLQGPYLFGRENSNFLETNFGYLQQYPMNAVATPMVFEHPHQYEFLLRESLSTGQKSDSSKLAKSSRTEQSRNR